MAKDKKKKIDPDDEFIPGYDKEEYGEEYGEEYEEDDNDLISGASEADIEDDEEASSELKFDRRSRRITSPSRRVIRFARVSRKGEKNNKSSGHKLSDASISVKTKSGDPENVTYVVCKKGNYLCSIDENGVPLMAQIKLYSDYELPQTDDAETCDCEVCTSGPKKNHTRSGGSFNWAGKYGEGRRLGN